MKHVTPKDCPELLAQGYAYLDVRTVEEFEAGHPQGAYNVPVMTRGGLGLQPNPQFAAVVARRFARDAPLVIGCQSGMRSQKACELLEAAGFTNLVNMECGFGGAHDARGGVRPGWSACGLPTETGRPAGRTYAELSAAH
ncbi:MAG: rhodanese-like domain-containing protein [Planctomycetes bacterium]|nr:rhodanese-like domain-containing protein [Planctomycetota bacterium]